MIIGTVLLGIFVFNLFLNPLNPWAAPLKTDQPFAEQASLGLSLSVDTTGYQQVQKLLAIMGPDAVVAVAPQLFPLVANDRYAYPLLNDMNNSYLPFNANGSTQFVVFDQHGGHLPGYLATTLYNTGDFGTRAWVPSTYLGPIVLFERNYSGPIEIIGNPPPVFPDVTYAPNSGLVAGPVGTLAKSPGSTSGYIIKTVPKSLHKLTQTKTGQVFHSVPINLAPGNYRVTVTLSGGFSGAKVSKNHENSTMVVIQGRATADLIERIGLNASWFASPGWTVLEFNFTLPSPVFSFEITGTNRADWFAFQVDNVTISAVTDS